MKKIKITHITIENFCGIKSLDTDIGDRTVISGPNAVGKSTIKNAIYWVLFDTIADGTAAKGIRPHDKNGKDVDKINISVELTLDIDGTKKTVKKVQKQRWTKHRGSTSETYEGNSNEFSVNNVLKGDRAYKEWIADNIDPTVFTFGTNPRKFWNLDPKKRRAKLLELEGSITNEDVIEKDPRFLEIAEDLKDGTVEELLKGSRDAVTRYNDHIKEIPVRIDEAELKRVDIDIAELEIAKNAKKDELNEVLKLIDSTKELVDKKRKLSDDIMKLQFQKGDAISKVNEANVQHRKDISTAIADLDSQVSVLTAKKRQTDGIIAGLKRSADAKTEEILRYGEKWKEAKASVFDETSTVCAYCGRPFEPDKVDEMRKAFEDGKQKALENINALGKEARRELNDIKAEFASAKEDIASMIAQTDDINSKIDDLLKKNQSIPEIDPADIPEVKEINAKIADVEQELSHLEQTDNSELRRQEEDIRAEIARIDAKIASSSVNEEIDARIEALNDEKAIYDQKLANEQRRRDLLEEFSRTRSEMLSDVINKHFKVIRFKLFDHLINGGLTECCVALVNGTSYDGLLNTGNKLLADMDICSAFQKMNNVELPILADDMESLDSDKIPNLGSQMIIFRREDGKGLKIEVN